MASTSPAVRPIRLSPLEAVHAALGATWVSEDARWPVSYGDATREAAAVAAGAGLADLGPIDTVVVRGRRTGEAMAAAGIPVGVGTVSVGATSDVRAWALGDDEVILVGPSGGLDALVASFEAHGAAVTDMSSGLAVLRLVGSATPAILERACPVDLSSRALANERIAQVPVVGVRMIVARQNRGDLLGYTLLVPRDLAEYGWEALLDLGRDLGLAPVGGTAAGWGRA
jgi:heterotetrameric sarcosine oxidase gamma subunit